MAIAVAVAVAAAAASYSSRPPPPPAVATAKLARPPAGFRTAVAAAPLSSRASSFLGGGGGGLGLAAAVATRPRHEGARGSLGCKCLFGLGVPELVVIAGVAALVFGPKQLPEIGRSIGKTVKSFQQAAKEFETELKKEPESGGDQPPSEAPKAVGAASDGEQQQQELEASSSSKDST